MKYRIKNIWYLQDETENDENKQQEDKDCEEYYINYAFTQQGVNEKGKIYFQV